MRSLCKYTLKTWAGTAQTAQALIWGGESWKTMKNVPFCVIYQGCVRGKRTRFISHQVSGAQALTRTWSLGMERESRFPPPEFPVLRCRWEALRPRYVLTQRWAWRRNAWGRLSTPAGDRGVQSCPAVYCAWALGRPRVNSGVDVVSPRPFWQRKAPSAARE